MTKLQTFEKPSYRSMWVCLKKLKDLLINSGVTYLTIPKIDYGRDKLDWRIVRNVLEVIFSTVPYYFHKTSHYNRGCM